MLGFFPTPYPDELLYSIIARFGARAGILSPKILIEEIFGSKTATAIVDLPCNLVHLCTKFPIGSKIIPGLLINKHTLFPIYEPFAFKEKSRKVYNAMLGNYGGNIHGLLGLLAGNIKYPKSLRFCPACWKEEQNKYGEGYWHRLHQVPGVEVCPIHHILLQDSCVDLKKANKHEFIPASSNHCISRPMKFTFSIQIFNELINIAKDIEWILNNKITIKSLLWLREQYVQLLIGKNLASVTGRVHQSDFIAEFRNYYGQDLLKRLQSPVSEKHEGWLSELVRKPRKTFHPLRHILLIRFLFGSVASFFAENHTIKPFGAGPWPCLNAAATHYGMEVVKKIAISYCYDTKRPIGTFTCSCDFVYSRRGPDVSPEDRYKIGRIKSYGAVWEQKLKMLLGQKLSTRSIAKTLRVDSKTVKKYSKLWDVLEPLCTEMNVKENNAKNKMEEWTQLCVQYSGMSVTFFRKMRPDLYMWLYRHQKEWLLSYSSKMKCHEKKISQRVNWEERDVQLHKKLKQEVSKILSGEGKPIRITVSSLGKRLGILSLLEKKIYKLPQTEKYLKSVVESVEKFQKRRVIWATKELIGENKSIVPWRIKKKAGLGKCSEEINHYIDKLIERKVANKEFSIINFK